MNAQEIINRMQFVSAGMGEVNERREENALREWLVNGETTEYTPELQQEWNEYAAEFEPWFDEDCDAW